MLSIPQMNFITTCDVMVRSSILYKSNVSPILEHGITVWSTHLRKHDKEIAQIQRRATGLEHYNYPERLQELHTF